MIAILAPPALRIQYLVWLDPPGDISNILQRDSESATTVPTWPDFPDVHNVELREGVAETAARWRISHSSLSFNQYIKPLRGPSFLCLLIKFLPSTSSKLPSLSESFLVHRLFVRPPISSRKEHSSPRRQPENPRPSLIAPISKDCKPPPETF